MTAILRDLPFQETDDEVTVGLQRIPIKPYQIIVWVSLTARGMLELPPHAPRLPVILDTGHNHNFSIQEEHLHDWAGLRTDPLTQIGTIMERGRRLPLHALHVWIHRNFRGQRVLSSHEPAERLKLDKGIAVYPRGLAYPALPLLGLRALVRNKLHFTMNPERCVVNLRTPDWRSKLSGWLS